MRLLFVLLLIASLSLADSFGYSRLTIERSWIISGNGTYDFTGTLVANDSNQRVVSVTTEPEMEHYPDANGTIIIHHKGKGGGVLKATAVVDVNYDPNITADSPPPGKALAGTNLTRADSAIVRQAQELTHPDSSLFTIRDLVNFVHGNMTYDLGYWGKEKSAREVFSERRGVCVEYTHLLLSLANSLGFETRYVSGYVYADSWQPHAWAEINVPGYGWLPADATFGQVGTLDNSHLAIRKSADQSGAYDVLLSQDENIDISAEDRVRADLSYPDARGVDISMDVDGQSYVTEVTLSNSNDAYTFGSYSFIVPKGYGGEKASVVLLRPNETLRLYEGLNHSMFSSGVIYTVPLSASFNDATAEETLSINGFLEEAPEGTQQGCASGFLLMLICAIFCAAILLGRR